MNVSCQLTVVSGQLLEERAIAPATFISRYWVGDEGVTRCDKSMALLLVED
ncbi:MULTISPECIES: hypothetical protein [unclassified Microcoleus]|uniref:hypothetical protein n=1 Tax=unclassified Microcoleus TaxID=2642155 RepID=UPI002FD0BFA3